MKRIPKKKFLLIAPSAASIVRFRSELINEIYHMDYDVVVIAPPPNSPAESEGFSLLPIRHYPLIFSRSDINLFKNSIVLMKLMFLIRTIRPNYIFSYTIKPIIFSGVISRFFYRRANYYMMVTGVGYLYSHGSLGVRALSLVVSLIYKFAIKNSTLILFQNPDDRETFKKNKILESLCRTLIVNGSGVNLTHYSPADFPDGVSFLMASRFLLDKGIIEYLSAATLIKEKYPNVKFYLAGFADENPMSISVNQIMPWVDDGTVDFLGKLEDVRPAIRNATVFVLPSYREGTPRAVLEAMSMNRPIITTDAPGCRETVIDSVNGFMVPPRDVNKLCEAMEKFILNPVIAKEMGKESLLISREKYDVRMVNRVMIEAFFNRASLSDP